MSEKNEYFDLDSGTMQPKIPGTIDNWESGVLGADMRYARIAPDFELPKIEPPSSV